MTQTAQKADRLFTEPGLFVVKVEGVVQATDISNVPWARPHLGAIARGVTRIQEVGHPIRGTHG